MFKINLKAFWFGSLLGICVIAEYYGLFIEDGLLVFVGGIIGFCNLILFGYEVNWW